jgi:hypothetical protein
MLSVVTYCTELGVLAIWVSIDLQWSQDIGPKIIIRLP